MYKRQYEDRREKARKVLLDVKALRAGFSMHHMEYARKLSFNIQTNLELLVNYLGAEILQLEQREKENHHGSNKSKETQDGSSESRRRESCCEG